MQDNSTMDKTNPVIHLPRGGYIVETSEGPIQFGIPPETIKDSMLLDTGVPTTFVLPKDFFYIDKGISVAEAEFPMYFTFYIKKQKLRLVCQKERINDVITGLSESNFGPEHIDLDAEVGEEREHIDCIPDLKKELLYFQSGSSLDTLVEFIPIEHHTADIGNVRVKMADNGDFTVYDKGEFLAKVPGKITYHLIYDVGITTQEKQFIPPRMGITCLGPSHGFDASQNTSGFILWLNHRGIMIDPPAASSEWLQKSKVNPKFIDSIILTHCHADHDAGTFQKILEETKITIYTTQTIMDSFIRKYSALTQMPGYRLYRMFRFKPVIIERPISIHQGMFRFFYTLHTIPAIGFTLNFRGKQFVYSSDHHNDPQAIKKMYEEGVFSEKRYQQLINFPWDSDIIYHEAGVPPIHTPITFLNSLPRDIQKRITVYHISKKDFPEDTDLTLATFGIENTQIIDVSPSPFERACAILQVLEKVEYFNSFTLQKVNQLLSVLKEETFPKGKVIFERGTKGTKFYIITHGEVRVKGLDTQIEKRYGDYETFGEASLILDQPRQATIVAETDVKAITIEKEAFLQLIKDTDLIDKLRNLSIHRNEKTWETLSESRLFMHTTSFQKTAFEGLLRPCSYPKGTVLIEKDKPFERIFLISSGKVKQHKDEGTLNILERGELVGDITRLQRDQQAKFSYTTLTDCELYWISCDDMQDYIEIYPNVYMNLLYNE